jgi:hypothetical protein
LERIERRVGPELAADVFHRRNMWLLFFGIDIALACGFLAMRIFPTLFVRLPE